MYIIFYARRSIDLNWTFVYKNFTTGGLETFVLRVGRYITYKGGNSTIVCFSISEKIKEQLTRAGVIIKKIDDWNIQKYNRSYILQM